MAQNTTTQPVSQPYGFPEIEPLPSRNWWEPNPGPAAIPSRPVAPDINMYPSQTPAMDAYYQMAMNPPVKEKASKLRMLGTGLLSALQGSTGPESRQPVYNTTGRVVGSREAGFWESLGNKPYNVDQAKHILDMPYEAGIEDYKIGTDALGKAAVIESNYPSKQALAQQRIASAQAAPIRADATARTADARMMDARTRERLALLKDVPESERIKMLQDGRMDLAEFNAVAAMNRVNAQQTGATTRTGMQIEGRHEDVETQQTNANYRAETMAGAGITRAGMNTTGVVMAPDPATGQQRAYQIDPETRELVPMRYQGQTEAPVPNVVRPGTPPRTNEGPAEIRRMEALREGAKQSIEEIDSLVDRKTGKLLPEAASIIGGTRMLGGLKRYLPGSPEVRAEASLNRLKNRLVVDLIGEMKSQSRTGATGFGQMNIKELGVLEQAANKLNPNMSEEDFIAEVIRIRDRLDMIMLPAPGTINVPANGAPNTPKAGTRQTVRMPDGSTRVRIATGNPNSQWKWEQ